MKFGQNTEQNNKTIGPRRIGPRLGRPRSGRRKRMVQPNTGSRYRLETFFSEEENHTQAPRWASNHGPLCVNVEIKSRSPQETEDFTGMLEKVEIKHKI